MVRPARPMDTARADRLLAAAAKAFVEHGFDTASLNGILAAVGMGKSSFYHYFGTKQALHDWVTSNLAHRLADGAVRPDPHTLTAESFWPAMVVLLDSLARAAGRHPETVMLGRLFHHDESPGPGSRIDRLRTEVTGWVDETIQVGQRVGAVRHDLPAGLLAALAIATLTALDRWVLSLEDPAREGRVVADQVVELVRGQLGGSRLPPSSPARATGAASW